MTIKFPCGICEKPVANNHQAINCDKCGLWIHIKYNKINKQTCIYFMCETCHWYCKLCTRTFLPYSVLNDNKFKQTVVGKQVKFTGITKPAIPNTEKFIKAINSENNFTKYFTIKDLNSAFNAIGNPFSLFRLNINPLSFHYDELESLISKPKNVFQEMKSSNKSWLTKGILKSINQKIAIYKKFIRAKNLNSKEIYHVEFKRYKSMINRLTRISKSKYYKTFSVNIKIILSGTGNCEVSN